MSSGSGCAASSMSCFSTWKLEGGIYMGANYLSNSTDERLDVEDMSSESIQMVSLAQTLFHGF